MAGVVAVTGCDEESTPDDMNEEAAGSETGAAMGAETGSDGAGSDGAGSETAAQDEPAPEDLAGEPCPGQHREARNCAAEATATQFCTLNVGGEAVGDSPEYIWGECLAEVECTPNVDGAFCDDDQDAICELFADGEPGWVDCAAGDEEGSTPLVLAFSDAAIAFEPMPAAAGFDIDGDGRCLSHDWPAAETPWLAADLDGNGTIDGGAELFGSGTRLDGGIKASDGFQALAAFDSDGDGVVTEADDRWAELQLWSDWDRDKRTDDGELEPLSAYGVSALPLSYERARRCDGRRNCGIERASFEFSAHGSPRVGRVVDVHLPCR
ncbi:MAG: calcium-binding protein [Myxococcota bacterium]